MRTDEPNEPKFKAIITLIRELSAEEHIKLIEFLREEMCLACGSNNPRCQCENDE